MPTVPTDDPTVRLGVYFVGLKLEELGEFSDAFCLEQVFRRLEDLRFAGFEN